MPVIIPTSATIFLASVTALFLFLVFLLLFLNKLLCFANCDWPTNIIYNVQAKNQYDSESDDSDEEIFNNFANLEKSNYRRMSKYRDPDNPLNSRKTSSTGSSMSRKSIKTAIVRVMIAPSQYNTKNLQISVLQTYDLVRYIDTNSKEVIQKNPYYQVHLTIIPEKTARFKTKSKQGPDPSFNETFELAGINSETCSSYSLRLRLYMSESSYFSNIIGQTTFNLDSLDLTVASEYNFTMLEPSQDDTKSEEYMPIKDNDTASLVSSDLDSAGSEVKNPELIVGLIHSATTGRLTVEIIRGVNFRNANKDYYVKLSLFATNGKELSHTKTSYRRGSNNPVFRESFMFQVAQFQLNEVTLIVSVFTKKSIHGKELIGWVAFGYKSTGQMEIDHWNEIKDENELKQIVRSYSLQRNTKTRQFLKN